MHSDATRSKVSSKLGQKKERCGGDCEFRSTEGKSSRHETIWKPGERGSRRFGVTRFLRTKRPQEAKNRQEVSTSRHGMSWKISLQVYNKYFLKFKQQKSKGKKKTNNLPSVIAAVTQAGNLKNVARHGIHKPPVDCGFSELIKLFNLQLKFKHSSSRVFRLSTLI